MLLIQKGTTLNDTLPKIYCLLVSKLTQIYNMQVAQSVK